MNRNRTRRFQISDSEILQILTAEESEDENDELLDDEDVLFLENDIGIASEVVIEGQNIQETEIEEQHEQQSAQSKKSKSTNDGIKWSKSYIDVSKQEIDFEYGKIKLLYDVNDSLQPMEIFEKTCNFDKLIEEVCIQSEIYMQQ